jgi:citrate synthase
MTANPIKQADAKSNDFNYAKKTSSSIYYEAPSDNAFVAKNSYLHGYEYQNLSEKKSFTEMLFLLFSGELPTPNQSYLLDALMKQLMCLGPRDDATRAAMLAGIGKSGAENILPTALLAASGEQSGALEVEKSHQFIQQHLECNPEVLAESLLVKINRETDIHGHICPGFGAYYGEANHVFSGFMNRVNIDGQYGVLSWCQRFVNTLEKHNMGWLDTGMSAAIFLQLGVKARESIGLYQLLRAPGLLAHGMEQTHKPLASMPFVEDQHYYFDRPIDASEGDAP